MMIATHIIESLRQGIEDNLPIIVSLMGDEFSDWPYWGDQRVPKKFTGTLGHYITELKNR